MPPKPKPKTTPTPDNHLCGVCLGSVDEPPQAGGTSSSQRRISESKQNRSVQCGLCTLWYHCDCVHLTKAESDFLGNSVENIHWFCNACNCLAKPVLGRLSSIETKLEALDQQVKCLEAAPMTTHTAEGSPSLSETCATEVMDRMRRAKNVIVFGITETDDITVEIGDLLQHAGVVDQPIEPPLRLGKQTSDKHRPVLIKLSNETDKWTIVKAPHRDTKANVFAKPDLTPQQRAQNTKLRAELKSRRTAGETEIAIRGGKIISIGAPKNGQA